MRQDKVISSLSFLNPSAITTFAHPSTYINKFVFGFGNGQLELWNIRTGKLLHSFQSHLPYLKSDKDVSLGVSCICQSPSVDIVAVGHSSGHIFLLNLRTDQVLFHFKQNGRVTSLSFRTDAAADKFPYMVSASEFGHLYTWQIGSGTDENGSFKSTKSKLAHTLKSAHTGKISKIEFLHGEPILVTSGSDNAVRMWIYDNPDGSPRLLRSRQGHVKYPEQMKYFGDVSYDSSFDSGVRASVTGMISTDASGCLMFTRVDKYGLFEKFSCSNIEKNECLLGKSLPRTSAYDFTYITARSWGNMVSIHERSAHAFVWKIEDKAAVGTILTVPPIFRNGKDIFGSAVAVSPCGNFAIVGYSTGWVCKFNIQSGLFRGSFPKEHMQSHQNVIDLGSSRAQGSRESAQHDSTVSGIFVDAMNAVVVTGSIDGTLIFWSFAEQTVLKKITLPSGIIMIKGHRDSNLVAVADATHTVRVYDIAVMKVCRVFTAGHQDDITDIIFSPDGRRLLSASKDSTVRVWDLPTSRCLSWMKFEDAVTSLSFTGTGELYVSRANQRGILVCADRSLSDNVTFNEEPKVPQNMGRLAMQTLAFDDINDDTVAKGDEPFAVTEVKPVNIEGELMISELPKAYWTSIFHMETLRKRKNVVAPVKKQSTPFFLSSLEPALKADNFSEARNQISKFRSHHATVYAHK